MSAMGAKLPLVANYPILRYSTVSTEADDEPLRVDSNQTSFRTEPIDKIPIGKVVASAVASEKCQNLGLSQPIELSTSNERVHHM